MDPITQLKQSIREYRDVDNELRDLNSVVSEKRDYRKEIETKIVDLIKLPQFQGYDKLKIDDDGSVIRIKKPETYLKSWSISQRELKDLLEKYFMTNSHVNAQSCFEFLVEERKKGLIANEYSLERVVKSME